MSLILLFFCVPLFFCPRGEATQHFSFPAHNMDEPLSRRLISLLRYNAIKHRVTMDFEGWVSTTKAANHLRVSVDDIERCAATSFKHGIYRFQLQHWQVGAGQSDWYIRATWGRHLVGDWCDGVDLAARPQKARPVKTTPTEMPPWKRQKTRPANVPIEMPPWERQIIVRVAWWQAFSACTAADFDKEFVLDIHQGQSIYSVKASIEDLHGIPSGVQIMNFKGQVLQNSCTVEHYMVEHGSTVYVVVQIRIFVKTPKRKMISLNAFLTDRVYKIWGMLCVKVPLSDASPLQDTYRLTFNGIELEDAHRTLNDYNIFDLNELSLEKRSTSTIAGPCVHCARVFEERVVQAVLEERVLIEELVVQVGVQAGVIEEGHRFEFFERSGHAG
jgi:hypothetical protein